MLNRQCMRLYVPLRLRLQLLPSVSPETRGPPLDPLHQKPPIGGFSIASASGINTKSFPENFKLGVSTSAYQIEGAWNEDGRGPSVWDDFVHENPDLVKDKSSGDIACDSYHRYKEDVDLLKEMGAQFYRFSISWSRILPDGTVHTVNQKGIDYYVNLLKYLNESNIEPIVTLYHWDLPRPLQEIGGWVNPDIVSYFGDYARICYQSFGQYVKYWVTINEPQSSCFMGYGGGSDFIMAPGYSLKAEGAYLCAYNHLKAHALAYHIYHDDFKGNYQGKVSLSFVTTWFEPASSSNSDTLAQELALQFSLGMFAHPIFIGNWPQIVIDRVGNRSQLEGLSKSRLPSFTQEEIDYIKGTCDWFGVNYYTTTLAKLAYNENELPGNASYVVDQGFASVTNSSWKASTASTWLQQVPWGLTRILKWIHDNYNQPEIIVTENGWSDNGSTLEDTDRIEYLNLHLSSILDAIYYHKVTVTGYTQWSLLDNYEWSYGYTSKFGTVSVDFNNENRTRTPKKSFHWYSSVIRQRHLNDTDTGDTSSSAFAVTKQSSFSMLLCFSIGVMVLSTFIE